MNVRPDGAGDHVVSLDAFKLTRHGGNPADHWELHVLTPWAQDLLIQHSATIPPHEFPQWIRNAHDRIIGVSFKRRGDALTFVADVAATGEIFA